MPTLLTSSQPETTPSPDLWMAARGMGFLVPIFQFFASLRLAVFILCGLIVVFATGTFVESFHGTETATLLIYQAPWFTILGFLLVLNLTASAVHRLPWKKKHIGFVMTHLGIILVLAGAFITKTAMVDAQVAIAEGETEFRMAFTDPVIHVFSEKGNRQWSAPVQRRPFVWEGRQTLIRRGELAGLPLGLTLLHYYPKGRMQETVVAAEQGHAAVQVAVQNSFVNQTFWLLEHDPQLNQTQLGPARFLFSDILLPESSETETVPPAGYLEFQFEKTNVRIPLADDMVLPAVLPLEGTPYRVTLQERYRNAMIVQNRLTEEEAAGQETGPGRNPAVVLQLEGDNLLEKHTAFAKFPEFPTMHGHKPSASGARILYRLPGGGSKGETHELRFVRTEEGLKYQIQDGLAVRTGVVETGKAVSTGWMDLQFTVQRFEPHARLERVFTPEPNTSESRQAFRSVEVEVEDGSTPRRVWLAAGFNQVVETANGRYHLVLGERRSPLGFKLQLKDFRIEHYQGTNRPASFESDVILRDDFRGVEKEVTISMNEPLDYNGYRIFQASYVQTEGQPDISVFSVVRDPGIGLKYGGTIVMISGVLIMFLTGRFTFKKAEK